MKTLLGTQWNILEKHSEVILDVLLKNRNIENVEDFLNPKYEDLHDPFSMKNMREVVERLSKAKEKKEKILIYGDYDVDGITSTVLLQDVLEKFGLEVVVFLPNRLKDGYGVNAKYLQEFKDQGVSILITVDNGIAAVNEVKKANELGLTVIVTDHHLPQEELPNALILNPLQEDCEYVDKYLCGVGIVYKLLVAMAKTYPEIYDDNFVKWKLDIVALGTVVDCAKLLGENRIITTYGLKVLHKTKNLGLKYLKTFLKSAEEEPKSEDLGFKIGPRLNAAGRIGEAKRAYEALHEKDEKTVINIVAELQELNTTRQEMVSEMMLEAYSMIDISKKYIFLKKDDWHAGIVGLLAGNLSREFSKPAFIMCKTDEGIVGSVRSPEMNLNVMNAINAQKDLLARYGGHKSAAGYTVDIKNYENLEKGLDKYFSEKVTEDDLQVVLKIDCVLLSSQISKDLISNIQKLAPFGVANEEPVFVLENVKIENFNLVGLKKNHARFNLSSDNYRFKGIAFNFGKYFDKLHLVKQENRFVRIAFSPRVNRWQGRESIDLHIMDIEIN